MRGCEEQSVAAARVTTDCAEQAVEAARTAAQAERQRLARDLHDSVTQALFSMTLVTRSVELLIDRDTAIAKAKLTSLREG